MNNETICPILVNMKQELWFSKPPFMLYKTGI